MPAQFTFGSAPRNLLRGPKSVTTDLSMAKDDGGASVTPGGNVSYTLAVANAGPSDAAAVSVTDTVPAGLVFVSATGTNLLTEPAGPGFERRFYRAIIP